MAAGVIDGLVYVVGGFGGQAVLEVYGMELSSWQSLADVPQGRHHSMVVAYNGRLYALASIEIFDFASQSWTEGEPLPVGLYGMPAVTVEERIFVWGGSDAAGSIDNVGRVLFLELME